MKRNVFLFTALLFVSTSQADDHTLVVKGTVPSTTGSTEVFIGSNDTITIVPAADVTTIYVRVTDTDGEVITQQTLFTGAELTTTIETPELPRGHILEISDNKGVVFTHFDD